MTCGAGYTTSDYALMTNIVWDPHYYNWLANHSADQGTNNQAVAAQIAASQTLKSADGTVPVIVGEYGPSTTGSGEDAGGMAAVSAVIGSGVGSAAWHWNMGACGDSCDSLDNGPTLSLPFGTTVAGYIASDATGAP